MNRLKIYYAVNLLRSFIKGKSLEGDLTKIREEVLTETGEVIECFGTGKVEDMRTIYNYDRSCVKKSDVVIAEVSNPSHGVGMELMYSIMLNKSLIALAREEAHVSRMVQGIDYNKFRFIRYKNLDDFKNKLNSTLKDLKLT